MDNHENGPLVPENGEHRGVEEISVEAPALALAQAAQSMYEASFHHRKDIQLDDMVGALYSSLVYEGVDDPANLDMRLTAQALVLDSVFNCLITKSMQHDRRDIDEDFLRLALRTQKRYQDSLQSLRQKKYRKQRKIKMLNEE